MKSAGDHRPKELIKLFTCDTQFMAVRGSRVTRVFPSGVTFSEGGLIRLWEC